LPWKDVWPDEREDGTLEGFLVEDIASVISIGRTISPENRSNQDEIGVIREHESVMVKVREWMYVLHC